MFTRFRVDGSHWLTHRFYHWAIPQPSPQLLKHRQCPDISWTSLLLLNPLILAHSKGNRQAEDTCDKTEDIAQVRKTKFPIWYLNPSPTVCEELADPSDEDLGAHFWL